MESLSSKAQLLYSEHPDATLLHQGSVKPALENLDLGSIDTIGMTGSQRLPADTLPADAGDGGEP